MLKKLAVPKATITWEGQEVAKVRGVSPSDLASLLVQVGEDLAGLFDLREEIDKMQLTGGTPDELADTLLTHWPKIVGAVGTHLPNLMAQLIARAADEPDEWEMVKENYSFVLQFEILVEIAKLTFNSPEGFAKFLGNVFALVDLSGTLTSGATKRPRTNGAPPYLGAGSTTSSPSPPSSKLKAKKKPAATRSGS